jgi:hypothetical protein
LDELIEDENEPVIITNLSPTFGGRIELIVYVPFLASAFAKDSVVVNFKKSSPSFTCIVVLAAEYPAGVIKPTSSAVMDAAIGDITI